MKRLSRALKEKMGSGASSSAVKEVSIGQQQQQQIKNDSSDDNLTEEKVKDERNESAKKGRIKSSKSKKVDKLMNLQMRCEKYEQLLNDAEYRADLAEKSKNELENQVADLESHNLDLQDRVQSLEDECDRLRQKALTSEEKECGETVKVKDQYINKLETQTKAIQDEIASLKVKFKKKLRLMKTELVASKQESSLKVFELKDEVNKLVDENNVLMDKANQLQNGGSKDHAETGFNHSDSRTHIILELSQQVAEQSEKMDVLEQKIREKDSLILELTSKQTNDCLNKNAPAEDYKQRRSSARRKQTSPQEKPKEENPSQNHKSASESVEVCGGTTPGDLETTGHSDIAELKAIAQEMKMLKKKKKPNYVTKRNTMSGTSRDSGLVLQDRQTSASSRRSVLTESEISVSTPGRGHSNLSEFSDLDLDELDKDITNFEFGHHNYGGLREVDVQS